MNALEISKEERLVESIRHVFRFRPQLPSGFPEIVDDDLAQDLGNVLLPNLDRACVSCEMGRDEQESRARKIKGDGDTWTRARRISAQRKQAFDKSVTRLLCCRDGRQSVRQEPSIC